MDKIQKNWEIIVLIILIIGCGAAYYMKTKHCHDCEPETKQTAPWQSHQWTPGPPPDLNAVPKHF